ncbi:peptidylprolyl isomerase CPR3 NDAI_0D03210 [Naumovozyma dairenensis CBS 421]|uniref:Peptidyl-prolyl cis-trans isomerase n=1 Tax=Naumovozyma dairenensis (strain ATCC 10597 / BCRC 20456 / CBS 421 / NBRC 0211 / NRRL Y-12639) TaxID=1071378 RepID=G0WA24_NAUDC|nr:hypothetical protein NDAI_0D03210 [Naumovozyma dairenensis CBS 421]CCD24635.1 hypothetical protein NDAI_0D03210 [Naumovozyma dairenensis CBS 421]
MFKQSILRQTRLFSTSPTNLGSKVFFKTNKGRIEFELYDDIVPKTAKNFFTLCTRDTGATYINTPFHRIIPGFMIQGGDTDHMKGFGGKSIYGNKFPDENFIKKHTKPGLLSMANAGPNTNGSQFFITTVPCPWLDGKHVVFGEVTKGMDVVKKIEACGSSTGTPKEEIIIEDAGEVKE